MPVCAACQCNLSKVDPHDYCPNCLTLKGYDICTYDRRCMFCEDLTKANFSLYLKAIAKPAADQQYKKKKVSFSTSLDQSTDTVLSDEMSSNQNDSSETSDEPAVNNPPSCDLDSGSQEVDQSRSRSKGRSSILTSSDNESDSVDPFDVRQRERMGPTSTKVDKQNDTDDPRSTVTTIFRDKTPAKAKNDQPPDDIAPGDRSTPSRTSRASTRAKDDPSRLHNRYDDRDTRTSGGYKRDYDDDRDSRDDQYDRHSRYDDSDRDYGDGSVSSYSSPNRRDASYDSDDRSSRSDSRESSRDYHRDRSRSPRHRPTPATNTSSSVYPGVPVERTLTPRPTIHDFDAFVDHVRATVLSTVVQAVVPLFSTPIVPPESPPRRPRDTEVLAWMSNYIEPFDTDDPEAGGFKIDDTTTSLRFPPPESVKLLPEDMDASFNSALLSQAFVKPSRKKYPLYGMEYTSPVAVDRTCFVLFKPTTSYSVDDKHMEAVDAAVRHQMLPLAMISTATDCLAKYSAEIEDLTEDDRMALSTLSCVHKWTSEALGQSRYASGQLTRMRRQGILSASQLPERHSQTLLRAPWTSSQLFGGNTSKVLYKYKAEKGKKLITSTTHGTARRPPVANVPERLYRHNNVQKVFRQSKLNWEDRGLDSDASVYDEEKSDSTD